MTDKAAAAVLVQGSSLCVMPSLIGGVWLAAENTGVLYWSRSVFCIGLGWETGDRLVRAEDSVETAHSTISLCSLDLLQFT